MATPARSMTCAGDAQVLTGIQNEFQHVASLAVRGSTYTMAEVEALIQSRIDAAHAIARAHAEWIQAVESYQAIDTHVTAIVRAVRQHALNVFGETSATLSVFGFAPPKRPRLTPEQLKARAAKAVATRTARSTKGKNQRAAIHGEGVAPPAALPHRGDE